MQVDRLLLAMGQEAEIVRAAGRYIRLYSPFIPIHGINLCIYRYLIAQGTACPGRSSALQRGGPALPSLFSCSRPACRRLLVRQLRMHRSLLEQAVCDSCSNALRRGGGVRDAGGRATFRLSCPNQLAAVSAGY